MPSSFFQEPDNKDEEKIKIGDKEFTQEELNQLVGLGEQAKELGDKHGGFDKFKEEFGKRGNRIGEAEKELEQLRVEKKAREEAERLAAQTGGDQKELTPDQKEAVKKLMIDTFGGEIMTKTEAEQWYQTRRAGEKLVDELLQHQKEIDGSDGRPKFNPEEIAEHMDKNGFKNPMTAYKDKFEKELDEWKVKQLASAKGQSVYTEANGQGGANRQPAPVKITRDNLNQLVREELSGGQQE